ncbi:hypothetical protein [Enterococcus pallens]|uniref:Uncharacterized protein n=1 Tax=Enterococcus pallens ATCC BAA-351 TaxID=1158607 RepID=R2S1M2_9ENTE|nr:hypothetical protein [Enterococcus pallens]EOH86726.1 hypothetical protein UAU_05172 [Enterococcus pallens ATCC BAA-351]EOU18522.1 hypothetical protein I588_03517 [Enterococcus pallens ATCC BAA-351]OJG76540.1 hypothetical protein RV10_GL003677 [Enterococcus pallens]
MKLTDKFKLIEIGNIEKKPRMLVSKHNIRFNKPLSEQMDYTEHVKIYLNQEEQLLAIVPCAKNTIGATKFYKKENRKCKNPTWSNQRFIHLIEKINGWDLQKNSYGLYPGKLDEGGIYFDFSKAKVIPKT